MKLLVRLFHNKDDIIKPNRIIRPPIVGVPCLILCLSGTSSSMISTAEWARKLLIINGPINKAKRRAVIKAAIDLNVTYLKTLKTMLYSASGTKT